MQNNKGQEEKEKFIMKKYEILGGNLPVVVCKLSVLVVFLLFVYHEIPNSAMVNKSFFTLFLLLNLYLFMVYSTLPAFERSISVLLIIFFVSPAEISSPI